MVTIKSTTTNTKKSKSKTLGNPKSKTLGKPKSKTLGKSKSKTLGKSKSKTLGKSKTKTLGKSKSTKKTKTKTLGKTKSTVNPKKRVNFKPLAGIALPIFALTAYNNPVKEESVVALGKNSDIPDLTSGQLWPKHSESQKKSLKKDGDLQCGKCKSYKTKYKSNIYGMVHSTKNFLGHPKK